MKYSNKNIIPIDANIDPKLIKLAYNKNKQLCFCIENQSNTSIRFLNSQSEVYNKSEINFAYFETTRKNAIDPYYFEFQTNMLHILSADAKDRELKSILQKIGTTISSTKLSHILSVEKEMQLLQKERQAFSENSMIESYLDF